MILRLSFHNFEVLIKWGSVLVEITHRTDYKLVVLHSPIIYNEHLNEWRHYFSPELLYLQSPDYRQNPITVVKLLSVRYQHEFVVTAGWKMATKHTQRKGQHSSSHSSDYSSSREKYTYEIAMCALYQLSAKSLIFTKYPNMADDDVWQDHHQASVLWLSVWWQ